MSNPVNILKERLARGEVSIEQYQELLKLISDQGSESSSVPDQIEPKNTALPIESDRLIINYNDKLFLHDKSLTYYAMPGERFPYTKITHLRCNFLTSTLNFVPMSHSAEFTFGIGESPFVETSETKWIKIASQKTKFMQSNEQKLLKSCYEIIYRNSYNIRQKFYVDQVVKNGFLKSGNTEIHRNGKLINTKTGISVNLKLAKSKGDISYGTHYGIAGGTSQFDPSQLYVLEEKKFFGKKEMTVTIFNNSDVIFPIIADIVSKL